MAHLNLNGIPVECSGSEYQPVRLGEVVRSFNGAPRTTARVRKRDYRFTTDQGGLLLEEAELLRALIEGEGHSWSFETAELYSSRKLLPSSVSVTDIRSGDVAGKHELGLFAEDGSVVEWPLAYDTAAWTLLFWRKVSSAWVHYVIRRSPSSASLEVWEDAVQTDADPDILGIDVDGDLYLTCNAGDETIDDLVALPYAVPDEWVPLLLVDRAARAWAPLPYVNASGPGVVPSTGLTCIGESFAARRVPMREEDGTFTAGEVFDFQLKGV
ncbi:hypothetical protein [Hyalangium sp.]|uniref:hypothetical protein n=1 Tax=Hyalangium sp. TaxID=2028555 RepID=UPI002D4ED67C|nr:hypothetical protein [Hyalangium sp.]HYH97499.1 hypothetical protein [Hyalangium sp.]